MAVPQYRNSYIRLTAVIEEIILSRVENVPKFYRKIQQAMMLQNLQYINFSLTHIYE